MYHTHVQTPSDSSTLQWLIGSVLRPGGHETRHLILGQFDLTTTEGREGLRRSACHHAQGQLEGANSSYDVGDLELSSWCTHDCDAGKLKPLRL